MHPKDDQLLPLGTKVEILAGYNKGRTAIIRDYTFLMDKKNFLHYSVEIEGREGRFVLLHSDAKVL